MFREGLVFVLVGIESLDRFRLWLFDWLFVGR